VRLVWLITKSSGRIFSRPGGARTGLKSCGGAIIENQTSSASEITARPAEGLQIVAHCVVPDVFPDDLHQLISDNQLISLVGGDGLEPPALSV
jgi:hypothetical protein